MLVDGPLGVKPPAEDSRDEVIEPSRGRTQDPWTQAINGEDLLKYPLSTVEEADRYRKAKVFLPSGKHRVTISVPMFSFFCASQGWLQPGLVSKRGMPDVGESDVRLCSGGFILTQGWPV